MCTVLLPPGFNSITFTKYIYISIELTGHRPQYFNNFCVVPCIVCFVSFCVLFVCKCVLYCTTATGWQPNYILTNVTYTKILWGKNFSWPWELHFFFPNAAAAHIVPRVSSLSRLCDNRHTTLDRTPLNEFSARLGVLYLKTQRSQETNIHASGEIWTRNPSKRAAANQRLRPRGYQDRFENYINHTNNFNM